MKIERTESVSFPLSKVEHQRIGLGGLLIPENAPKTKSKGILGFIDTHNRTIRYIVGSITAIETAAIISQEAEARNIEGVIGGGFLAALNLVVMTYKGTSK